MKKVSLMEFVVYVGLLILTITSTIASIRIANLEFFTLTEKLTCFNFVFGVYFCILLLSVIAVSFKKR